MTAPRVRVLLKGRQVDEVPFRNDVLRIGRMRENDVAIQNLAVSRYHATLTREGDAFVLEDSGSENGCYVNGERTARAVVRPSDRIQIGKHELAIVAGDAGDPHAETPAPHGPSDAWDGSATYVVGFETGARLLESHQSGLDTDSTAPPALPETEATPQSAPPDADSPLWPESGPWAEPEAVAPLPEARAFPESEARAFPESSEVGEEDLAQPEAVSPLADPVASNSEAELFATPEPWPGGAEAGPFEESEAEPRDETEEDPTVAAEPAVAEEATQAAQSSVEPAREGRDAVRERLYAGLILQRGGRFVRVMSWDGERLTLGRGVDCEVVLAAAEVSRRHAMLVREDDRYEVRDLDSINGTHVNGEKISRRVLEVGDVIRIDDFELTFVLEDRPIGDEIRTTAPSTQEFRRDPNSMTQLGELSDLAPFAEGDPEEVAEVLSFDTPPPEEAEPALAASRSAAEAASEEEEAVIELGEPDLLEEEKPLSEAPADGRVLALEVRVRMEELPRRLREALAELEVDELRLPAELCLHREDA
jgi:pSer/pThr/pTyr-binding forkhead associated (FHA) protein